MTESQTCRCTHDRLQHVGFIYRSLSPLDPYHTECTQCGCNAFEPMPMAERVPNEAPLMKFLGFESVKFITKFKVREVSVTREGFGIGGHVTEVEYRWQWTAWGLFPPERR